jgi:ferric-dicitrate binding protein FerR (iron transport regulator)
MLRILSLALVILLTQAGGSAAAEVEAGAVRTVRVWAYGTPPAAARRDLFANAAVFVAERLETVADGALDVRLRDDTSLRLGGATTVVLDRFVYDPASGGALAVSIAKGACRFITGATADRFVVTSPSVTVAPRGTQFSVWVFADGTTKVWVQAGEVTVTPLSGGPPALVRRGEIVAASTKGGGVQRNALRPETDPGLLPSLDPGIVPRGKSGR